MPSAEVVVDYLRKTRGIKVGVVDLVMFRPFPADLITGMLAGKKAVTVFLKKIRKQPSMFEKCWMILEKTGWTIKARAKWTNPTNKIGIRPM